MGFRRLLIEVCLISIDIENFVCLIFHINLCLYSQIHVSYFLLLGEPWFSSPFDFKMIIFQLVENSNQWTRVTKSPPKTNMNKGLGKGLSYTFHENSSGGNIIPFSLGLLIYCKLRKWRKFHFLLQSFFYDYFIIMISPNLTERNGC